MINSDILKYGYNKSTFMEHISTEFEYNLKLNRIYSGKNDGFDVKTFHNKCDNKGRTIILVKNEYNTIFGGYASESWTYNNIKKYDISSFLYQYYPNKLIFNSGHFNSIKNNYSHYCCRFDGLYGFEISNKCNKPVIAMVFLV